VTVVTAVIGSSQCFPSVKLRDCGNVRDVTTQSVTGQASCLFSRVRSWIRATPVTLGFIAVLAVTSFWIAHSSDPDAILESASTNIKNLTHMPLRSFFASAVVLSGGGWLIAAAQLMVSAAPLERARGSFTMLKVFASGHVIATLLTEGGVAAGIAFGLLPHRDLMLIDVGISYGAYACLAAALVLLPRRWRVVGVAAVGSSVLVALVLDPGMTPVGHLLAVLVGLAWWPQLARIQASRPDRPDRPVTGRAVRVLSATA
jgi:hypothetical protein